MKDMGEIVDEIVSKIAGRIVSELELEDITAGLMWLVEAGFTTYRHYERYYGLRYR